MRHLLPADGSCPALADITAAAAATAAADGPTAARRRVAVVAAHGVVCVRQRVLPQREQIAQLLRAHKVGADAGAVRAAAAAAAAGAVVRLGRVVDHRLQALLGQLPLEHLATRPGRA